MKNSKKTVLLTLMLIALVVGGILAYLTATHTITNSFSIAESMTVEVVEPSWNEENAKNILPGQTVAKDPAIKNTSNMPVYVFADVSIPTKDMPVHNTNGTKTEAGKRDLFEYTFNNGWKQRNAIEYPDKIVYRYEYKTAVAPNTTTQSIFDTITACNFINGQFNTAEELKKNVIVKGYAVQASGFTDADDAYNKYFELTQTENGMHIDNLAKQHTPCILEYYNDNIYYDFLSNNKCIHGYIKTTNTNVCTISSTGEHIFYWCHEIHAGGSIIGREEARCSECDYGWDAAFENYTKCPNCNSTNFAIFEEDINAGDDIEIPEDGMPL